MKVTVEDCIEFIERQDRHKVFSLWSREALAVAIAEAMDNKLTAVTCDERGIVGFVLARLDGETLHIVGLVFNRRNNPQQLRPIIGLFDALHSHRDVTMNRRGRLIRRTNQQFRNYIERILSYGR